MTTPDHHQPFDAEPFSDEERELAAQLGRIGPVAGPSPALDAKILAAAHAASVPRKPAKRRGLAWLGVPPALVTGVGVAAAAVLVLGVVWQLRPQYGAVTARSEADAGEEIILIAPPSDRPASRVADAAAVAEHASSPAPARMPLPKAAAPAAARAVSVPEPMSQAAVSAPAPASAPVAASEAGSLAPAAPEAFARTADAAADARPLDDGFAAPPSETRERRATYTTAARAAAERRERNAAQKASAIAREAAAAGEAEGTTLDRVEVTGSRIRTNPDVDWSEVPVNDDTHLASVEWLERIRARRDDGDVDNARASLKLFQREYPRVRLPDDLRAFVETEQ
ncbi:hypothetical protein [Lysobacter sp. Root494]|uniref:hypothetical protein n=1 Tax=Lysobacter sp. Root494 TaxID=1736549 RepID=UPI000701C3B4|nr:hypothetical protein [Lysobacter sp. Root494]KQY51259.1 hypothetical protein ASD14_10730 [Lysobacter sp. Root494]